MKKKNSAGSGFFWASTFTGSDSARRYRCTRSWYAPAGESFSGYRSRRRLRAVGTGRERSE